jgi:hypothetical protein
LEEVQTCVKKNLYVARSLKHRLKEHLLGRERLHNHPRKRRNPIVVALPSMLIFVSVFGFARSSCCGIYTGTRDFWGPGHCLKGWWKDFVLIIYCFWKCKSGEGCTEMNSIMTFYGGYKVYVGPINLWAQHILYNHHKMS